jgi:hypothetical protein
MTDRLKAAARWLIVQYAVAPAGWSIAHEHVFGGTLWQTHTDIDASVVDAPACNRHAIVILVRYVGSLCDYAVIFAATAAGWT